MPRTTRGPSAADDWNTREPVFGRKGTFAEAFPEIAELHLEAIEKTFGSPRILATYHFSREHTPGEFVSCSNSLCRHGGFRLGALLRDAVREQTTSFEAATGCVGHENMGRHATRDCLNRLYVTGTIVYTSATETNEADAE